MVKYTLRVTISSADNSSCAPDFCAAVKAPNTCKSQHSVSDTRMALMEKIRRLLVRQKSTENGIAKKTHDDDNNSITSSTPKREKWTRQFDFIMSGIGYCVGLGNLYRFPYLCMRNGGGAFLLPYFVCLFTCAIPLYYLEVALAQYSSSSPLTFWRLSPLFKGLGYGMIFVSGITCIYYNVIMAWVLYFLGMSFAAEVPWGNCGNEWNSDCCLSSVDAGQIRSNSTGSNSSMPLNSSAVFTYSDFGTMSGDNRSLAEVVFGTANQSSGGLVGLTQGSLIPGCNTTTSPAEEFWQSMVLGMSSGIEDLGTIRWQLLVCLTVAWLITFLCLSKGVKSTGVVVYFTATLPYICLTILMVRGATLPGSLEGVKFYLVPNFTKIAEFKVWCEAGLQVFFSLGAGWGGPIIMAGYNNFHNNIKRDALLIPIVNGLSSVYGGFVIFSVIGHMAHVAQLPVDKVVKSGPGLAFIAYPEAIALMPLSPLWAILFFMMLLTLGLDSQFVTLETLTGSVIDEFPELLRKRRTLFTFVVCALMYFIGFPLVTNGGIYVFQFMDWYCAAIAIVIIAIFESVVLAYIYGVRRICEDIEQMVGQPTFILWKICWWAVTPGLLMLLLVFTLFNYKAPTYGSYQYPDWAEPLGWTVAVIPLIPIPAIAAWRLYQSKEENLKMRFMRLLQPSLDWHPQEREHRRVQVNGNCVTYTAPEDSIRLPDEKKEINGVV